MTLSNERQAEIRAATKANPVTLTQVEVDELREESRHRFQADFGGGKYRIPAKPDSPGEKMLRMKLNGKSNAEIGDDLGLSESTVRRIIERLY